LRSFAHLFTAILLLLVTIAPSHAQSTITVTSLADDGGPGELRAAINQANTDNDGDTITFANGLTGTIMLTSGLPTITASVTVQGPGAGVLAVDGAGAYRPFYIDAPGASVAISGLAVQAGSDLSDGAGGAGIYMAAGGLDLSGCTLSDNTASSGSGGGIYNVGSLSVTNCTLSNNTAESGGGGAIFNSYRCNIVLTNCILTSNVSQGNNYGGGVDNDGVTVLNNCTLSSNDPCGATNVIYSGTLATSGTGVNANNSATIGGVATLADQTTPLNSIIYASTAH